MYKWVTVMKDGSLVEQYNVDRTPREISSESIDYKNVDTFILFNDEQIILALHLDEGQRLIYRRRVEIKPEGTIICHLIGWQMTVNGQNVQSIAYCFENGMIELAGKFREGHDWFYPIVHTEKEKL